MDEPLATSPIVQQYRIEGECDECAIEAAALATGYPDNDIREGCANVGCRFYSAEYAERMARLDVELDAIDPAASTTPPVDCESDPSTTVRSVP